MAIDGTIRGCGDSLYAMAMTNEQAKLAVEANVLDGTPQDVVERYQSLRNISDQVDFGWLDSNVVVIDTESTGLSYKHDELTQIAAARMEKGQIVDWFTTFVNPGRPIPEDIVHLTGITDEDVAGAPTPYEALAALVDFAGNSILVAHNVAFDKTFVTKHPSGYPLLENTWIDSLDLSRIVLPRLKSHRLIDLVNTFGAPQSTHRADQDVAATCVIYRVLLAGVASMPQDLVRKIGSMASSEEWSTRCVFSYIAEHNPLIGSEPKEVNAAGEEEPRAFSLRSMRRRRVKTADVRLARKDADSLASDPMQGLEFPSREQIRDAFESDGVVGKLYDDYEARDEQVQMALAVRDAFSASENLAVEAGTGVGKSMAYLIPAVLTAKRNDIAVGVATKTNSLLDQLVYKELPALSQAYEDATGEQIVWAALKGMSHYPCLRKVNHLVEEGPGTRMIAGETASQAPALAALLSYIEQTLFDDMDAAKIDFRLLSRAACTSTSAECLRRKCPFYNGLCFVHAARRKAEAADIVVTNHTLLFCDIAAEGALLPPIRYWIIDEAHGAEDEARRAFTATVSAEDILSIIQRVSETSVSRNVFTRAESGISKIEGEHLTQFFALQAKARSCAAAFVQPADEFVSHMKDLLYFDPSGKKGGYDNVDLWVNGDVRKSSVFNDLVILQKAFEQAGEALIKSTQDLVGFLEGIDEAAAAQRELASVVMDLRSVIDAADLIFSKAPENYAYQASLCKKKDKRTDKIEALLLDVGNRMNETLYARTHSVIFASATLAINGTFSVFENTMGLNSGEFSQTRSLLLDSSFDFDNNMIIYVAEDMPEPNSPKYKDALVELLVKIHLAQQGSVLTLFTNRREMESCFEEVRPRLKAADLRVLCQKWGVSVKGLRDDFLADEHLSLFALKSFWQGFDAPGATLKAVVIPKLPFARPTDPLYCERASRDDAAWRHYVLPQAVIETKQAAGRLIRKASDHGALILADKRLLTKNYGGVFLKSLQSKTVRRCSGDEIARSLAAMREWI